MAYSGLNYELKKKIKRLSNSKKEIVVLKNFFFLSLLQIANYILPLITLPYLIRVVEVEHVGEINFATSLVSYFIIITTFGYNFNGTKYVSNNAGDAEKISSYYSKAMVFRFCLLVFSFFLLTALVAVFDKFQVIWLVCFLTFGTVISNFLFPVWIFQGLQEMKYITWLNVISKLIFTLLIFVFVNEKSDYYLVPFFTSFGGVLSGIVSIYIISSKFNITFCFKYFNGIKDIKQSFLDGKHIFLQQLYVSFYGPINIVFLGLLIDNLTVGHFTIAEKIVAIPVMFSALAVQAYYPYAVKLYQENKERYYSQLVFLSKAILLISVLFMIILFLFDSCILTLITGQNSIITKDIFNILIFGICFSCFGQMITQIFVTINKSNILSKISFFTMIITLILSPYIITNYNVLGLSMFVVFRQAAVILVCFIYLFKYRVREVNATKSYSKDV